MAVLDFQGEIIAIDLPNPEDTQIWVWVATFPPTSMLFLQLPLVVTAFIWQVWIGCHGNSLIDVEEKPKIWNVLDNAGRVLTETAENRQTD